MLTQSTLNSIWSHPPRIPPFTRIQIQVAILHFHLRNRYIPYKHEIIETIQTQHILSDGNIETHS